MGQLHVYVYQVRRDASIAMIQMSKMIMRSRLNVTHPFLLVASLNINTYARTLRAP